MKVTVTNLYGLSDGRPSFISQAEGIKTVEEMVGTLGWLRMFDDPYVESIRKEDGIWVAGYGDEKHKLWVEVMTYERAEEPNTNVDEDEDDEGLENDWENENHF